MRRQINSTTNPVRFLMVSDQDGSTGVEGLAVTVTLCKSDQSAYAAAAGTVSELGGGVYQLNGHADDRDTLGVVALRAVASGVMTADVAFEVVAENPLAAIGAILEDTNSAMALLETIIARTSSGIVVSSAFLDSDGATLLLRQGESYEVADNNAIEIDVTDYRLTSAITTDGTTPILRLAARNGVGASLTVSGAVVSFDSATSTATLRFEATSAQSATLKAGPRAYRWEIDLQLAGSASRVLSSIIDHPCTVSEQIA